MVSRKVFIAVLLLSSTAFSIQAAEIPLGNLSQPCVEHSSFNNKVGHQDMINPPGSTAQQLTTHCLTSIQSSNSNKLFGTGDLLK